MYSIVMPSSSAFLTTSSFIYSLTRCYPFLPVTMQQLPLKKTRYQDVEISDVPSLLVSCNPITSQLFAEQVLSRVSMCPIPLTLLTVAVRTLNMSNVSPSSRDLALAALGFLRADFLSARFPRRLFRANPSAFTQFLPSSFRRVGCGTPTTPRLLHRRHFSFFTCALQAFFLSSLRVPRFPRRRCPNFATAGTVAAGNDFALLGCIIACRCCWQACTVSVDEFPHQSTP